MKISLAEARQRLEDIQLIDVFASLVTNELLEDKEKLREYIRLTDKIYQAEKYFNINDIRNQIHLLVKKQHYYDPFNSLLYYKEKITQEVKDSNKDIYDMILTYPSYDNSEFFEKIVRRKYCEKEKFDFFSYLDD